MMDFAPLQCNVNAIPSIESSECLLSASPLSSLIAAHGSSTLPLTVPCGACVVADQTDGSTVTIPGGLNILGRLHFPPTAHVTVKTTSVIVQGMLSAEEPSVGNKVKVTLFGTDEVMFYPHEQCCMGTAGHHRGLRSNVGQGRELTQNGCDLQCPHAKNVSMKPIVVAGGKLDIRAVNPTCPSWTVLGDVKSIDPPPFAAGCNADGSILQGDGTFESGIIPNGMVGLSTTFAIQTETDSSGTPNKFLKVGGRSAPENGIFIEMDAGCAVEGRRYRFSAKHRLDNGATNDEFLGAQSYQKPGQDWVHKHFLFNCKNRISAPGEWSTPCHGDFLIDENVAGAAKIRIQYFPTNQAANVDLSFDDVRMDLVYDPLVTGLKTGSDFASCLDVGDEVMVASTGMGMDAWKNHQIFTVGSVDAAAGSFDFLGQQMYQTFPTLNGPGEPEYATEVARLTRRFVFEALDDGPDSLLGGHFIIMHTPSIAQTISGLEIRNFGQQGRLGRYPVHFHMSGDVSGSIVSKNVVRDSNQRCYVMHGTDNAMIVDNVALNAFGHCYILEDGAETGNTFERNLAAQVDTQPFEKGIGSSDHDAASFWITNVQNNYIGNVAAGGKNAGYWFETLGAVIGPSANLPQNEGVIPMYLPLGQYQFKDNVAHSCRDGVRTYFPGWKPSELSVIEGLKAYKNSNVGIFIHGTGNVVVKNALLADNWDCVRHNLHNSHPNFVEDSRCVGLSQDVLHRFGSLCRTGIQYSYNEPPEAQLQLRNITFEGWAEMESCDKLALYTIPPDRTPFYAHATLLATDLFFETEASKPDIPCSLVTKTGDRDLFLEDVDGLQGSPTGIPGFLVQDNEDMLAFLPNPIPVTRKGSCAVFVENVCLRRVHISTDIVPGEDLTLVITDGATTHSYGRHPYTNNFEPVLPAGNYDAHFENANGVQVYPGGVGMEFHAGPLCSDHIDGTSIKIADNSNTDANLALIPEAQSGDYQLVYELNIPANPKYQFDAPVYSVDNHLSISSFDRIAYYLELDDKYVWVSMNKFTDDVRQIGVPCLSLECGDGVSATVIQQIVSNVNVKSNVPGLSGSGYAGNVEFWPFNYVADNTINIPGASSTAYDFGDTPATTGNYGSMQVHVHGSGSHRGTIFAFNRFNDGAVADVGIGNKPNGQPDWALSNNANSYGVRKLQVYVAGVSAAPPTQAPVLLVTPSPSKVPSQAPSKALTEAPVPAPVPMPVAAPVTQVTDSPTAVPSSTPTEVLITPSPTMAAPVTAPAPPTSSPVTLAIPSIPDSAGFELVYDLDIPTNPNYQFSRPLYSVDNHLDFTDFDRVAYYLELGSSYVWVSMDKFADDPRKIGVPCKAPSCGDGETPTVIQQMVTNVNVVSNVPGLSGSGYTGNVEFWPFNYSPGNFANIPGASSGTFDFGDTVDMNGLFGSMQVHVNGGGSYTGTVFAFNRFNEGQIADLGIGNSLSSSFPDWSLAQNAHTYGVRNLKVFVASNSVAPSPSVDPYIANKNIQDAEGFQLVYALDIPTSPNYMVAGPNYSVDNSLSASGFSRIAYYLELDNYWVWVSMDKFTNDARQIGVPCFSLQCGNGIFRTLIQKTVTNVNVASSIGMLNFSGRAGNVEFWPYNYAPGNALGIPGADSNKFDFGDTCESGNGSFGSMQVHVHGGTGYTGTIFAFNYFNNGAVSDLGISNNPNGHPDWTLSQTAKLWLRRHLRDRKSVV